MKIVPSFNDIFFLSSQLIGVIKGKKTFWDILGGVKF